MRTRLASTCLVTCALAACGGRQHQHLGTGHVNIAGRPVGAAPLALPAQSPGGRYRVHYQIWLPRAMEVSYTLRCGGHEESGVVGETFEQYQVRRTAELQAERQRERERRAQVGSLIGGAVLGQAQAGAAVATPNATGAATVTVDGAAAGAAAGAATVTDAPIVLAPDDLGQGFRQGDIGFQLGDALGDGAPACAMELTPLDAAVDTSMLAGTYSVERWFDAKRAERVRVAGGVTTVRADLRARLIARGADPQLAERKRAEAWERLKAEQAAEDERQRRLRAEEEARLAVVRAEEDARRAQQQAEEEARRVVEDARRAEEERVAQLEIEAQARIKLEMEARLRFEVMSTREALIVYYGTCGGNRHHREELRQAEERRRITLEMEARMRLQMSIDIRARLRTGLIARGADPGLRDRLLAEAAQRAEREEADRQRRIALADAESRRRAAIEEEERRRRRAEHEAELRRRAAEEEARAAADLLAWQAEQAEASRRISIVVGVRAQLTDSLIAMGARLRPPMPPAVDDRGHWTWSGAQWMWIEGATDIVIPVRVDIGIGASTSTSTHVETSREPVREHRSTVGDHIEHQRPPAPPAPPPPTRDKERDHRATTTTTPQAPPPPPAPPSRPRVRDHR